MTPFEAQELRDAGRGHLIDGFDIDFFYDRMEEAERQSEEEQDRRLESEEM